ncbi:hypothetical protein [Streptomyces sp. NPDC001348]
MTTTAATDADDTGAHPRFAATLDELGLAELRPRVRRFPEASRTLVAHAGATLADVRERAW